MSEPYHACVLETVDREIEAEQWQETAKSPPKNLFRLTHIADLLAEPEPLRWLIKGYLLPGSLCLLFGEPAAGKSLLSMNWAASIATGLDWCGHRVTQGPVAYIAGEGHFGIRRRFKAWALHHECEQELKAAPLFVSDTGASFTDPESLQAVIKAIDATVEEGGPPVLIVIDTLHRNLGPGDENSSRDMAAFVQAADTLRTGYGAAVLIVHHTGHGSKDRARGSSALRAAVDAEFMLKVD